ncbi:guanylate-binding protein 1-like [Bufo gargarizans]|uniref:guanylate-binding protein 1-like n=1 Tax=Bufo gargarizans TaxID=30331 RepID=UPI001CF4EC40|nr:guanylate-binding protein 1-like [Bufo gargarizans]
MAPLMPLPVCLIENVGSNLVVNPKAKKILSRISEPVIVVSIVGKYRTGKSFLMNRLVGRNNGFPLGSSIQSKTKGIWMWCVPHPWIPGHVLVLLDTEGLGDVEKGDSKNDAWIFCLSVLLSSALVYNSIGTIDQQAIEQLHYVTELTEVIKLKSTDTKDETAEHERFLPSFTWCVRDFTLSLERDGKEITEDEYLMMGLELKTGANFQQYNLPRECIRSFFHSHKCFVFDRPTSTRNLHRLDELKESEIEEEFMEQAAKFYEHIMRNSRVKALTGGITVTGKMLGNLTSLYVDTIRSGEIPSMENAVLTLAKIENAGALQDAMSKYEHEMERHLPKFPIETELDFLILHMKCTRKAIKVFMERSVNDQDQTYLQELKNQIVKKKKEFMKINEDLSREVCKNLLQTLSQTMQIRLQQGCYSRPGGHKAFLMDKHIFLDNYQTISGKGVKSLEVLEDFIHENQNIEAAILQAEEKITQADQRLAESHNQALRAEQQRQSVEQQNRDLQQSMIRQSANHQQFITSLTERMEQNRIRMAQETNSLITQQLQAQQSRMSSSHQQSLDEMQRRIEELRRQNGQGQSSSGGGGCILS